MKFRKLFLLTAFSLIFLVACEIPKVEIIKDESFKFESIDFKLEKFKWDKAIVSTDTETLVLSLEDIVFIKTEDESSSVHLKITKETVAITELETKAAKIYLNAYDVKKVSKDYAETYSRSLEFKK
ncbi:hypothetical protein ACOMCU_16215 [Lysinibacillus sp. UGB7]|uniref:hypothetical protein n=1 Tax=Lysinibacillus sp. UGB7 TaxID=3411039 RepID=UPI003B7AB9E7